MGLVAAIPVRHTEPMHVPAPRKRVRLAFLAALAAVSGVLSPHKVALTRLFDMPLAVLGTGAVDFAAFHWHWLGWIVTGLSLWLWNEILADDGAE